MVSDRTDLARLQRDLAEDQTYVRASVALIGYSLAMFMLGMAVTKLAYVGVVVLSLAATFFLFGVGAAIRYGMRAARYSRQIRVMTRLPVARLLDR